MGQRRKVEKWETGLPPLDTVHVWPNPWTHGLSMLGIVLLPIQFYADYQVQIWMLINREVSRLSEFGFSWGREKESWFMVLGWCLFWFCSVVVFFATPAHISIKPDCIRLTSIWGLEKRFTIGALESLDVQVARNTVWGRFGGDHFVRLKFAGRRLHLVIGTHGRGAKEFSKYLLELRPGLFSDKDISLIFEDTGL